MLAMRLEDVTVPRVRASYASKESDFGYFKVL